MYLGINKPNRNAVLYWQRWLFVLLTAACVSVAESTAAQAQSTGAPVAYSAARTDRAILPYPKTAPEVGPAGSIIRESNFSSRIIRVTDANTDPARKGQSFHTPASAQQNTWNTTSTKFYVIETGGRLLLYNFDPDKMAAQLMPNPDLAWRAEPQFSYSQENLLYGTTEGAPLIQQYDVSTKKVTAVHNPADCVKLNPADHGFDISVSADDQRFMIVVGPKQNANYLIYLYDRQKGCRWFNTDTGEIGGQWGAKGKVSGVGSFTIHDARVSKSGEYVVMTGGGEGPVVWDVDTLNATLCTRKNPMACGGHHAIGYSHMINPSGRRHPFELLVRSLDHLDQTAQIIPDLPGNVAGLWYDKHISWNNVDPNDSKPACLTSYTAKNPNTRGEPLVTAGPWENEVVCLEMDGKGSKVWRFAHTYSTGRNGFWSTPRGNVSQDGRFFMFTSDWEDELGQTSNGKEYRHDVFVVELR